METRAYKNLNTGSWSIKQRVEGKWTVVGHCTALVMRDVSPHVSDARHNHVRKGNYREVFAWLVGDLLSVEGFESYKGRECMTADAFPVCQINRCERVTFHPFADEKRGFYWVGSAEDFRGSAVAYFTADAEVFAR